MNDVGTDLVEQRLQAATNAWAHHERQCVVEGEISWPDRSRRKSHDMKTVHDLFLGCARYSGRDHPHFVTPPDVLARHVEREVCTAGRPRRKETVDDEDSHPARR